jgi:long-chain acyl-CoA synthetase
VPRLLNKVFDAMQVKINDQRGFKKWLVNKGIKAKIKKYKKSGKCSSWFYDMTVFKKMRQAMGGKIKYISSGSAPINADTLNFLRIAFSCNV